MVDDTYRTISVPSEEALFKDKGSKFFGYAYPVESEEEVKALIAQLKKQHHSARHWCYAYQIGKHQHEFYYRANDDGEPNNSAGMPIYGQIQSFEITNVLIVVVRYFGGTKLGVSGLINAYRMAAKMSLEASTIITKTIMIKLQIQFGYQSMNKVMRCIKEKHLDIAKQIMEAQCELHVYVREKESDPVLHMFSELQGVKAHILND